MKELIKKKIIEHADVFNKIMENDNIIKQIEAVAKDIYRILDDNGRILLCGNGGSASDAQHIAAEFVGRFQKERSALDVETLTVNTSTLTAVANDYGYEKVFSRQVKAKGRKGDMFIGITTSGKSANVIEALKVAKEINMTTVLMMGDFDCIYSDYCDYVIAVPSKVTARIQEGHIFIGHTIAECVENQM